MSGTAPGTPPARLPPPRRPRRMNGLLLGLGVTVVGICTSVAIWEVLHAGPNQAAQAQDTAAKSQGVPSQQAAILAKFPKGRFQLTSAHVMPPEGPPPHAGPTPVQTWTAPAFDPNMTADAIAARKQAWQDYHEQVRALTKARVDAMQARLGADLDPGHAGGPGAPGGATNAAWNGPQVAVSAPLPQGAALGAPSAPGGESGKGQSIFETAGSNPATDYSPFTVVNPISHLEIVAGDHIEAGTVTGITSASHGQVTAIIKRPVFDHATGNHILIPQGAQLVGVYQTGGITGQDRIEVGFTRIIYPGPCQEKLDLGIMPGADMSGYGGLHDLTETFFWTRAKELLLASVFSAGVQLSQPQSSNSFTTPTASQTAASALGQQLGEFGISEARNAANIQPVQEIRNGYNFTVQVIKDIPFAHEWNEAAESNIKTCAMADNGN